MEDDKGTGEKEGKAAEDQKGASTAPLLPKPQIDEKGTDYEQEYRTQQWKIRREWLTIAGLFLAAAAAIYQGVILSKQASLLSKQADAMSGQLAEMKSAVVQTDKLISSNADLAAAAKLQAAAQQQLAVTAHDSLTISERARIAA